ncbi:hypothetical protein Tco_1049601 [Tanacetum coccineum]
MLLALVVTVAAPVVALTVLWPRQFTETFVLPKRLRLAYIPKEDTEPAEDTNSSIDDDKDYILLLQYGLTRLCRYNTVVVYYGDPSTNTG